MKKLLITGTAGFIGNHLFNLLCGSADLEITGLDVINDYYDPNLKLQRLAKQGFDIAHIENGKLIDSTSGKHHFIKLDLADKQGVDKLFEDSKFDYVVNLAAQAGVRYSLSNPEVYIKSNIDGFLNIIEACRHNPVKHLIYASTSSVYGLNQEMPFGEEAVTDHPVSLYAATKKTNELMAHTYAHLFNIPSTGLRFFTVYGPWGRPDMALFLFTKAILSGEPINVFNNGKMMRDFTYVSDIVESIARLIDKPPLSNPDYDFTNTRSSESSAPYRVFNIGNNNPVNLMDFIHAIEEELDIKAQINYMPLQPGDVKQTYARVDRLESLTNFKPQTSVQEGIHNFITWYREYYQV
ncbi:MAG: NAD-dependent epimerase [Bacteroidota bacterium]|nr:NAD-dependent epimerase [Bacteroidota bacterium]